MPTNISASYLSLLSPLPPLSFVPPSVPSEQFAAPGAGAGGVCVVEIFFKGTAEKWSQDGKQEEEGERATRARKSDKNLVDNESTVALSSLKTLWHGGKT